MNPITSVAQDSQSAALERGHREQPQEVMRSIHKDLFMNSIKRSPISSAVTLLLNWRWLLVFAASACGARANTYTWTGTGFFGNQDRLWSNDFNWSGNIAPSSGETNVTLVFPNDASPRNTTNDISGLTVSSIVFLGGNYVIHGKPSGNPLTFQANPGLNWTVSANIDGNQIAGDCPVSLVSTGSVAVAAGATFSINSLIYGPGEMIKKSPGTLKFAGAVANLYSGGTTVMDGVLALSNSVNAVPGKLSIGGTNTAWSPIVRLLADNQIADAAPVFIGGNGQLQLNTFDDKTGSITVTNGGVVSTGSLGSESFPGLLTLNGNITNAGSAIGTSVTLSGHFDLGGATRNLHSENYIQVIGVISGTGGVVLSGPGVVVYYGSNTYSGQTLVQKGKLRLAFAGTPGNTASGTTVEAGAALVLQDIQIGNEALSLHGGAVDCLTFEGTNTWKGPIALANDCILNDDSKSQNDSPDLTIAGAISGTGALRKRGTGSVHFTGLGGNTYSGGFFCEEGDAYFEKSASAPALSGPLVISVPEAIQAASVTLRQINQIPNAVPISLFENSALRSENNASDTLGPVEFKGGALFAASGLITLAGDVTNHFTSFGPGGIYGNVAISGDRIFHCDSGSVLKVPSALSGAGRVMKTGAGEMTLSGPCSYSQGTSVYEGTLRVQDQGRPGDGLITTTIFPGAVLHLDGANLINYGFYLEGGGANNGAALVYSKTNYLGGGEMDIHNGVTFKADPGAKLTLATAITGSEGLRHEGNGTLVLAGNLPNTYSGGTAFREGTLQLAHASSAAIPHSLAVGYGTNGAPAAVVQCLTANQFAALSGAELGLGGVTLYQGALLDCGGHNQTIANLNLTDASVATGAGQLALLGNIIVQPGASAQTFLTGTIQLNTGINNSHLVSVASNTVVFSSANFTESGMQNIFKDGAGQFGSLGALIFSGTLTVHQGRWLAANANAFGGQAAPTIVDAGATLMTYGGTISEPLQLAGNGDGDIGALYTTSTNLFDGPITLTADATISADANALLAVQGAVGGPGRLTKEGTGILQFTGVAANNYTGGTIVSHGTLELTKNGSVAVPGDLTCLGNAGNNGVRLLLPDQIADSAAVILNGGDFLNLNNNNEIIGSLSGSGAVQLGSGTLTTGGNGINTDFSGSMSGSGGLTKAGAGSLTLLGNKAYTGTTTVNGGKLIVNGQQPQSAVSINNGGTLGGTGRVGSIGDLNGAITPGASPGILACGDYSTFNADNQLQIEINGSTPGSGYDQLQVNGNVLLMGGTLQVLMNTLGAVSNEYVIVSNDGADAVNGTFTGLAEGDTITSSGAVFAITYHGGDGNDIALIQQSTIPGPQIISSQKQPNGRFAISALGTANLTYAVEASTNLAPPVVWEQIGTGVANSSGNISFSDVSAPSYPQRFYRLRYQ